MLGRFFKLFCALFIFTIMAAPGAAQAATASGKVTTNHWKKGAAEGYSLTATVTVPLALARLAVMTLTGPEIVTPVTLTEDASGTTYSAVVTLAARPLDPTAYTVTVTYIDSETDPTPADTLILPVTVVDSFATLTSPMGGVAGTTNPTFTWQAPALAGLSGYRLSISGLDNGVDGSPWLSAQLSAGTLSAQYQSSGGFPSSLTKGVLYEWYVYTFDSLGNSSENRDGAVMIGANISGTVTDLSGAPVAGATVSIYYATNGDVIPTSATTKADGSYLLGGLNSTNYRLRFSKDGGKPVFYNNRLGLLMESDPLLADATKLKTGIDAKLGWGAISGKVVNSSGTNLSGVSVALLDGSGNATSYPAATTKSDGTFSFTLLPLGNYRIRVIGTPLGYADLNDGSLIPVTEGDTSGQNVVLNTLPKVNITGTVTDLSGAPLSGIWVYLYDTAGTPLFIPGAATGADGSYALVDVPGGSYKVGFLPGAGSSYAKQYYNRKATTLLAENITVGSTVVTNINAVLGTGRPVITAFTVPATSPTLTVSGITFSAIEGTGVAGYLINESGVTPAADAAGWRSTPPTSYTFAGVGEKTLYAWAKGATGLVSASSAASVSVEAGAVTPGDSNGDGVITIAEVKLALDMYLKLQAPARFVDADGDDVVTLLEVQKVINAFLAVQ